MTPAPKTRRRRTTATTTNTANAALSARILNRMFDDFGDRDPIEDYVEVSQRVRSEEMDW